MKYNTPPRVEKRGAMPAIVTVAMGLIVFTSIPLAQLVDGWRPASKEELPTEVINPHIDDFVYEEPEKEEEELEIDLEDVQPPSFDQIEAMLNPLTVPWQGDYYWETPVQFDWGTDLDDIVSATMMDSAPRPVVRAKPKIYRSFISGQVDVEAVVDKEGHVVRAKVIKGIDRNLDKSAKAAAMKWRFEPGTVDGKPTRFRVVIPFVFQR